MWMCSLSLQVLEVIKNTARDVEIATGDMLWLETRGAGTLCGTSLKPGASYVLYPYRTADPLGLSYAPARKCLSSGLATGLCSPLVGPDPSQEDVAKIRAACAPVPARPDRSHAPAR
jgi:hypothetical protein